MSYVSNAQEEIKFFQLAMCARGKWRSRNITNFQSKKEIINAFPKLTALRATIITTLGPYLSLENRRGIEKLRELQDDTYGVNKSILILIPKNFSLKAIHWNKIFKS